MQEFVQERRREYTATTVTPLTCYQVITAENMQGDQFKANGRVLAQVSLVGIMKSMEVEGNSIKMRVHDAMGYECEIQKWGTDVASEFTDNLQMQAEERKYIVRAHGHVRSSKGGEKVLMATRISLVQHFEEFMSHQLYASYCLQYHKNGPLSKPVRPEDTAKTPSSVESVSPPQQPAQQESVAAAVPPPALPEAVAPQNVGPDQATIDAIKKAIGAVCMNRDDGVHKDKIVQSVSDSVHKASCPLVRDQLEKMIVDGDLFTTKDAFHVSG